VRTLPPRLAYLTGRYPKISHTFVMREVDALRSEGVDVETLSIHRTPEHELYSEADRRASETTTAVLPHWNRLVKAQLWGALRHPRRYLAVLALAMRLRPAGARGATRQLAYFAIAVALWRHCKDRGVRHVHAQFADNASDVALLLAALGGSGWSWSIAVHGPVEFRDLSRNRLAEKVRRARFVICISDFGRSQVMSLVEETHWDKVHVVHCGVRPDDFRPAASDQGASAHPLRVINVGRLVPLKGQAVLIDAVAELVARGLAVELEIIGDGPDRERLEQIAQAHGLNGAVRFIGPIGQDEIRDRYAWADVLCVPSFAEGLPVVLMEAMAMEKPVVATQIMGIPELVENGTNGLLVPPGRVDALAAALGQLAEGTSSEQRLAMGRAGRAKVTAEFDVARSARQLREIFARSLAP
jgi:glycosyltransferase involved in cell wall biosynthesis